MRDRLLLLGVAAELANLRQVSLDVVAVEVDDGALLALLLRIDRTAPALVLEHAVVDPGHAGVLDRPAREALPEGLGAVGVLGRQLDVHDAFAHLASFFSDAIRSAHGQSNRSLRRYSGSRSLRAARRAVPQGRGRDVPPRARVRRADG